MAAPTQADNPCGLEVVNDGSLDEWEWLPYYRQRLIAHGWTIEDEEIDRRDRANVETLDDFVRARRGDLHYEVRVAQFAYAYGVRVRAWRG